MVVSTRHYGIARGVCQSELGRWSINHCSCRSSGADRYAGSSAYQDKCCCHDRRGRYSSHCCESGACCDGRTSSRDLLSWPMGDQVWSGNRSSLDCASGYGGYKGCGRSVNVNNLEKQVIIIITLLLFLGRSDSGDAVGHDSRVFDRCQDRGSGRRRTQYDGCRSRRNVRDVSAAEFLSDTGQLCNILSPRGTVLGIASLNKSIVCKSNRVGHLVEVIARCITLHVETRLAWTSIKSSGENLPCLLHSLDR
jgi:hypothetical protein